MKPNSVHPASLLAGFLLAALLLSAQSTGNVQRIGILTPEQLDVLGHLSIVHLDDGQGGVAKTIRVTGVNLQLVNGLGATNGLPADPDSTDPVLTVTNGVGNLIVGYNEMGNPVGDNRTGSHNVVVGHGHNYVRFGGLVAARDNTSSGAYACVTGGTRNRAIERFAAITGGRNGLASGVESAVHGGVAGTASGVQSAVHGGTVCSATGDGATVCGGNQNTASGALSAVLGGQQNQATALGATVSGGADNSASGNFAAVAGGNLNQATGNHAAVAGGHTNTASGFWSAVSGGQGNDAGPANQNFATVGGGLNRATLDSHDWAAGSLLEDQ